MYFQQIYRFEVDLLKKFTMSLSPEQSHPREISAGRYEFGWWASPNAAISKGPTKHNYATTTISPALISIVVVLGIALLMLSYYKIFAKYWKASQWRHFFRRRYRSLESKETHASRFLFTRRIPRPRRMVDNYSIIWPGWSCDQIHGWSCDQIHSYVKIH